MPVTGLNHINIRTTDVAASMGFYVDVFGFEIRPEAVGGPRNWLYDKSGHPIIHLRVMAADCTSTGPLDHVALNCQGKAEILERLNSRGVEHSVFDGMRPGATLIFLKDPHGIALELNFMDE